MIGTPVSCTLWSCTFTHRNLEPPPVIIRPGMKTEPMVSGEVVVCTADPTGADLCDVAARVVVGPKVTSAHQFTLTHVHRVGDARGLANVEGGSA